MVFVFIFLFLINFASGQTILNLDSLEHRLSTQADDTIKIQNLIILSGEYKRTNPERALKYGSEALRISRELNYIQGEIDALHISSSSYKDIGKFDSAYILCNKAITISDSIGDAKRLAENYLLCGGILYRTKGPQEANLYYLKSLHLFEIVSDSLGIANSYNGIALAFMMQSQYDSAIINYHIFIKISEKLDYKDGLGKAYVNIGIAYSYLMEFKKAKSYLLQSIETNEQLDNKRYIGIAYSNLGNIAYDENDYNLALEFYNKTIEIYLDLKNLYGLANLYLNIGNIHIYNKEYNKAFEQYTKAKNIYKELGDTDGYIAAYENQGVVYNRRKNYDQALIIYDSCLTIAKEINSIGRIMEIYKNIFKIYELKQNYTKAFEYQSQYNVLKDSIFNIEKAETISELEIKYEKEKDQALILALENENLEKDLNLRKRTNQRNTYLFSGSGIILIILFLLIFYRNKSRKDKIIADQKIKQLEEEKKLLAARFLVEGQEEERKRIAKELHDGLGVLLSTAKMQFTTIKDKSPENKPLIDKATKLLEQAAGDVRKISHNMMPGLLTKFGLFEATEDLFDQLNETEGLNAICEITGDTKRLPENTEIMLYRIFQEMVNNTLKHAKAKNISLNLDIQTDQLNIGYSDDGKGFNVEEKLQLKSVGLQSIQSRVNFLEGKITINSESEKGTKYDIKITI
jgi:signal transduction histidine kinase